MEEAARCEYDALPSADELGASAGVYFQPQEFPGFILQRLHYAAVHLYCHVEPAAAG